MPRYFFNIYDGEDVFDCEGIELLDVRDMRLHMLAMATKIITKEENQREVWQMEALDEDGRIVCTMDFGLTPEKD